MLPDYPWLDQSGSIGSEVFDTGWRALIERMLVDIDGVLAGSGTVHVLQMKEKLGALRFYHRFANATDEQQEKIEELIATSVEESMRTCIVCGRAGRDRRIVGLIMPFCDDHDQDDMY